MGPNARALLVYVIVFVLFGIADASYRLGVLVRLGLVSGIMRRGHHFRTFVYAHPCPYVCVCAALGERFQILSSVSGIMGITPGNVLGASCGCNVSWRASGTPRSAQQICGHVH